EAAELEVQLKSIDSREKDMLEAGKQRNVIEAKARMALLDSFKGDITAMKQSSETVRISVNSVQPAPNYQPSLQSLVQGIETLKTMSTSLETAYEKRAKELAADYQREHQAAEQAKQQA